MNTEEWKRRKAAEARKKYGTAANWAMHTGNQTFRQTIGGFRAKKIRMPSGKGRSKLVSLAKPRRREDATLGIKGRWYHQEGQQDGIKPCCSYKEATARTVKEIDGFKMAVHEFSSKKIYDNERLVKAATTGGNSSGR